MASDLISRDQLLGDLYAEWLLTAPDKPVFINGELIRSEKSKIVEEYMKMVENQPTVDAVEVVHGEWKQARYTDASLYICSKCDKPEYKRHNYCPNCGAKMDGGDKE